MQNRDLPAGGTAAPEVVRMPHDHPLRRFIPEPEATSTFKNDVVDVLGQGICSGEMPPGHVLNMDELATRFGVSRPVVREACGVLSSLGLVVSRRRAGTVVQPQDQWELFNSEVIRWRLNSPGRASQIRELSELRSSVEPDAAVLAAERATLGERAEITTLINELLAAGAARDIPAFHSADKRFHAAVMTSGHNAMFAHLHHFVEGTLESRYRQGLMPDEIDPLALVWHRELGEAVVAGDAQAARAAALNIVTRSAEEMIELSQLPVTRPIPRRTRGAVPAQG
ncbi:FadR/GntR family transcriptional regulator [Propionibacteriaceae bacterium Y1923]|uniref:FadR/GntR family transcriptional regulator n=1 Tax=Aestuariimicrobium sp. Y1814 TaxID=3418742 RepID=UPI003C1B679F